MNVTKSEKRFSGTYDLLNEYIKRYEFKQVADKYDDPYMYVDKHANILRWYESSSSQYPVYWRVIMYDRHTSITNAGYKLVYVGNRRCSMHQIMAHTWLPNPQNKTDVDHIDGDKLNNNLDNLRWVTKSENMKAYHEAKRIKESQGNEGLRLHIQSLKRKEETYTLYIPENEPTKLKFNIRKVEEKQKVKEIFDWAKSEETKIKDKLRKDIAKMQNSLDKAQKQIILEQLRQGE